VRTTLNLEPDVWAAVLLLQKEKSLGIGAAVNALARHGMSGLTDPASAIYVPPAAPKFPY
jgi:hypothetical protein